MYFPKDAAQMTTPFYLLTPTVSNFQGVRSKGSYTRSATVKRCNFKTYGGTETQTDGLLEIIDTATVVTLYDPNIKSGCRIELAQSGAVYEIINEPEDIEQRKKILRFKVRRVKGGA